MACSKSEWVDFEIEDEFWELLEAICETEGLSDRTFVERAQDRYPNFHTESAVRIEIVEYLCRRSGWMPGASVAAILHLHETVVFPAIGWTTPMIGDLVTRNVKVERGQTTIALEPYFWEMLNTICMRDRVPLTVLVQEIDNQRDPEKSSRASALRLYVAKYFEALAVTNGFGSALGNRIANHDGLHVPTRHLGGAGRSRHKEDVME